MTTVYAIAMIAVAAVCTFATRVAPFLLFNGSKPIPPIIRYLGSTLPPAVIAAGRVLPEKRRLGDGYPRYSRAAVHRHHGAAAPLEAQ